jgi:hypothetical protein
MTPNRHALALTESLEPVRQRLMAHPLYAQLDDARTLHAFMRTHVFAVWDFQCLLKSLQQLVTCVRVPWIPTPDPEARRLINEIVLDEESDVAPGGGYLSHFELYLLAMERAGADGAPVRHFIDALAAGQPPESALRSPLLPPGAADFVAMTLGIIATAEPHRVAAAFAYGREEIIPDMFRRLVDQLADVDPDSWETFRYYLERHITTDADRHGPQARALLARYCQDDARLWAEAATTARVSLEARLRLWDAISAALVQRGRAA